MCWRMRGAGHTAAAITRRAVMVELYTLTSLVSQDMQVTVDVVPFRRA